MAKVVAGGVLAPLFTPLDVDGRLALDLVPAMVRRVAGAGVDGVWILGVAGEGANLTPAEKRAVVQAVAGTAAAPYLMVSVAGLTQAESLEFCRFAEQAGADALAVLPPPQLKLSEDELFDFYQAVCRAVSIPVTIYQNPPLTGVNFSLGFLGRLAGALPTVVGVHDSTGDVSVLAEYRRALPGFLVWNGRDGLCYPALLEGATGTVGATTPVAPELFVGLGQAVRAGDHVRARSLQDRISLLARATRLGSSPTATKAMANLLGMAVGPCRPPLRAPEARVLEQLRRTLAEAGLL